MPTGSGAHIAVTRLPSAPRSISARVDIGTIALSTMSSVGSPWSRMYRPSAPATTASTTSLTVPPSAFLIALKSARSPRSQVKRRWGPIVTLKGLGGAGWSPAHASAPSAISVSPAFCAIVRGPRNAARTPRTISRGAIARSSSASASSSASLGSGRGIHSCSGGATGIGSGAESNRTVAMSTPEMPSTSAWWVLDSTAKRSSASPSTSHSSHSGRVRSSGWEKTRPAMRLS